MVKEIQRGWIKVKGVLFRDPHNIAIDQAAEARNLGTADGLYQCSYFAPEQAVIIKRALVCLPALNKIPEIEALQLNISEIETGTSEDNRNEEVPKKILVDKVITDRFWWQNLFEKRKASSGARPCGPHDMGPIYSAFWGIAKEELKDEEFLRRLKRDFQNNSGRLMGSE